MDIGRERLLSFFGILAGLRKTNNAIRNIQLDISYCYLAAIDYIN